MAQKRSANYVATLVYMDEPQLILLKAYKTNFLGVAIPSDDDGKAMFFATAVNQKDFGAYLDGNVDLRFLFTYPGTRTWYTFDLMNLKDDKIMMEPWEGDAPDKYLPKARFFSRNHTEEYGENREASADSQELLVDGEWDMPEFGVFYTRYSDVYYFLSTTHAFGDDNTPYERKKSIKGAFRDTPFKGGFSYVHFYDALASNRVRQDRLRMDKIRKESPGYLNMKGDNETFDEVRSLVRSFLKSRPAIKKSYGRFYSYLSRGGYLSMAGDRYERDDSSSEYVSKSACELAEAMGIPNIDTIMSLVDNNPLVFAKIVLSFYRRLDDAARFFAEGRMSFS